MGSHSKLFLCFKARPSTLNIELDDGTTVDCSGAGGMFMMTSYLAAAEKKRKDMQRNNKSKKKEKFLMGDQLKDDGVNNHPRRKLSRAIKAVLFETVLKSGRFRKAKSPRKHPYSPRSSMIEQSNQNTNLSDRESTRTKIPPNIATEVHAVPMKPVSTAVSTAKPCDFPSKQDNRIDSEKKKPNKKKSSSTEGNRNSDQMMQLVYLVLFSLLMTVFWGRFLAVMTTTAGIYACESQRIAGMLFAIGGKKKTARVKTMVKVRGDESQCNTNTHQTRKTIA